MADGRGWLPGQSGGQENEGPEDLASLRRTNRMIDAIAADLPVATSDSDEYAVAMLLASWRDDVGREQMPAGPTLGQARNALRGRSGRSRLLATTVGSAAAVTLLFGGFGAAVYQSHPGDALYGLRTSLFGAASGVRTDPVVLSAQTELAQVEKLISQGDWTGAQQQLEVAAARVNQVGDAQQKAELASRVQQAEVRIDAKNPQATVPPEMVTETPRIMLSPPSIAPGTTTTSVPSVSTTTPDSTSVTETSGSASTSTSSPSPASTSSPTSTSDVAPTSTTSATSVPTSTPVSATVTTTPPSQASTVTSTAPSVTGTTTMPSGSAVTSTSVPAATATTTAPSTGSIVTVPTTPEGVTIVTTRPSVVDTPAITAPTTIEAPAPVTRIPDSPAPNHQAPVNNSGSGNLHGSAGSGVNAGSGADSPARPIPVMTSVPVAPANPGSGPTNPAGGAGSPTGR